MFLIVHLLSDECVDEEEVFIGNILKTKKNEKFYFCPPSAIFLGLFNSVFLFTKNQTFPIPHHPEIFVEPESRSFKTNTDQYDTASPETATLASVNSGVNSGTEECIDEDIVTMPMLPETAADVKIHAGNSEFDTSTDECIDEPVSMPSIPETLAEIEIHANHVTPTDECVEETYKMLKSTSLVENT